MTLAKAVPFTVGALAVVAALSALAPPGRVNGFDMDGFGHLPVLEGGRVKPVDTVARNALLMLRSKQTVGDSEASGAGRRARVVGASEWLLDVMFRPAVADRDLAFYVDDPEVLGLVGLPQTSERYLAFATLAPHLEAVEQQASAAHALEAKERSRFQSAVTNLYNRLYLYYRLRSTAELGDGRELATEIATALDPRRWSASRRWRSSPISGPCSPPPRAATHG